MPRWSRQKKGRKGRAHAPRQRRQPLPPSRRRRRAAARGLPRAGNENEQRYLLPLLDLLAAAGIHPDELWADRGYASRVHELALAERRIRSCISQRRKPSEPIPPGQPTYEVWRGKKRRLKTRDPQAR